MGKLRKGVEKLSWGLWGGAVRRRVWGWGRWRPGHGWGDEGGGQGRGLGAGGSLFGGRCGKEGGFGAGQLGVRIPG